MNEYVCFKKFINIIIVKLRTNEMRINEKKIQRLKCEMRIAGDKNFFNGDLNINIFFVEGVYHKEITFSFYMVMGDR